MTVYDTRQRCLYCRKYDLPCNDAVHGNPLFPYLGAVDNAVPVIPGMAEPVTILPTPAPQKRTAAETARTLSTVALIVLFLVAGIVAIGAITLVVGVGRPPCDTPPCAPVVEYVTPPTVSPTLP